MDKIEATEIVRRYLPPPLAESILAALDSEFRVTLLEARFREHTEVMDHAIQTLGSQVYYLAQQINLDHQHTKSKE
jgi:hypothetical protein